MSSQFCMHCGKPLSPDSQFCMGCGSPIAGAPAAAAPGASPPVPPPPPPPPMGAPPPTAAPVPAGPPLSTVLGLQATRNFLLQHQLVGGGRSYRVLNHEKRHLFTVKENYGQEMRANFLGAATGLQFGGMGNAPRTLVWALMDGSDRPCGSISIQLSGMSALSAVTDSSGAPILTVNVERGLMGGLTATASAPDGSPLFQTKGNLIRHSFTINDPSGKELAKIHEAMVSIRDTYNLDLVGNVDPLGALLFAILIDREKQSN